jgi:hypothetical protein
MEGSSSLFVIYEPMLRTVEGFYHNGQIQLTELPQEVSDRTQVLVTFIDGGRTDPQKLRELIDQLETIAGIQQGFEELEAGQTRPIGDFIEEIRSITREPFKADELSTPYNSFGAGAVLMEFLQQSDSAQS